MQSPSLICPVACPPAYHCLVAAALLLASFAAQNTPPNSFHSPPRVRCLAPPRPALPCRYYASASVIYATADQGGLPVGMRLNRASATAMELAVFQYATELGTEMPTLASCTDMLTLPGTGATCPPGTSPESNPQVGREGGLGWPRHPQPPPAAVRSHAAGCVGTASTIAACLAAPRMHSPAAADPSPPCRCLPAGAGGHLGVSQVAVRRVHAGLRVQQQHGAQLRHGILQQPAGRLRVPDLPRPAPEPLW